MSDMLTLNLRSGNTLCECAINRQSETCLTWVLYDAVQTLDRGKSESVCSAVNQAVGALSKITNFPVHYMGVKEVTQLDVGTIEWLSSAALNAFNVGKRRCTAVLLKGWEEGKIPNEDVVKFEMTGQLNEAASKYLEEAIDELKLRIKRNRVPWHRRFLNWVFRRKTKTCEE